MRPFLLTLFPIALALPGAAAATDDTPQRAVVADCRVTPSRLPEPPAWLLLAGAVLALGAGRVAGR